MDDLINDFIAETREMLEALGSEIVAWEAAPDDRARLDSIFRFVHTVKGNCGFFDLPRLAALSHAAENVLDDVRKGARAPDGGLVNAVLAVIDRIGELVEALETGAGGDSEDDDRLIAALAERRAEPRPSVSVPSSESEPKRAVRSIRLSVDLLDRMMSGVSDMVLARNELARRLRDAPGDAAVDAAFERMSASAAEMRDIITRTRMQRIDNLFGGLPRLVRDLGAELGKSVALDVNGGDVELDREMIEMIRDPLTHIVRNAIDHGIEPPEARAVAEKPATGALRVSARQAGNQILIEIADDGRGIDHRMLAAKAITAGILSKEECDRLPEAARLALIFEPGLSTAAEVTEISGRGVGMDVVRANVERIGGVIEIDSSPGQGTRLTLRVPLTLTIIPALTVSAGGHRYAIPRSAIDEIVRCKSASVRIDTMGGSLVAKVRDRPLPVVSLPGLLGLGNGATDNNCLILLKPIGGDVYALAVDDVHDHEELVIKPAAPLVMAAQIYAGTTLADDGCPILLLDPSGIAAVAGIMRDAAGLSRAAMPDVAAATEAAGPPGLLFRGLDGVRRAIRLAVVERIEDVPADAVQFSAGALHVIVGEAILPLHGCALAPEGARLRILRISDGARQIAYGFGEVIDIVPLPGVAAPARGDGEICGVVLIDGAQVELVEPYALFAGPAPTIPAGGPVCALPEDDPWIAAMLRPVIEAAGYRVVPAGSEAANAADVVIANSGSVGNDADHGRMVKIRATAALVGDNDDSVYRYDRAALLNAIDACANQRGKRR